MTWDRVHTKNLLQTFGMYLTWQIEDPNWRLSQSQIEEVNTIRNIIKRRLKN